jgi:hypothetical protein
MAELLRTNKDISFTVNILAKAEYGMFTAHCLELDIVAVADTLELVQKEIVSLVCAQIDYAFSNDNLDNLFHPAPPEAWQELYRCKEQTERKYAIKSEKAFEKVPPWLITKTCTTNTQLHYA